MLDVDFDDFEFGTERTAPRQWVAVAPAIAPRRPARHDAPSFLAVMRQRCDRGRCQVLIATIICNVVHAFGPSHTLVG